MRQSQPSSGLDCSELKEKLDNIQQGLVVVLCETSEDVAALHHILKAEMRDGDKLITNDPGSDNEDFHSTDLVVNLILNSSEEDSEGEEEGGESEGDGSKSIILTLRSLFNIPCEHAFLINTPQEVLVKRRFGMVTNEFLHIDKIIISIIVLDPVSDMFQRREVRVGKDSHVDEIQKELDSEFGGTAHMFINNKMSQLQDDDRVVEVVQAGDVLTGLGVPHDKDRSKEDRTPGAILVMADTDGNIIFLPIIGPQVFKFRAAEFSSSIAVFRKQCDDGAIGTVSRAEGDDLYIGHSFEIPQNDELLLSFKIDGDGVYNMRDLKNPEILKFKHQKQLLEEAFQKPIGKEVSFMFENFGEEDVYVINGRKTSFDASLLERGACREIRLVPDHRTSHQFGLAPAGGVITEGEGRRDFPAVVFSIGHNLVGPGGRIRLNTTNTKLAVTFFPGEGEELNLPASTTERGELLIKTFRETERICAEDEREEWLKWLRPNT